MTMEQFAKLRKSDPHIYQKFLDSHQAQERSEVDKLLNFLRGASTNKNSGVRRRPSDRNSSCRHLHRLEPAFFSPRVFPSVAPNRSSMKSMKVVSLGVGCRSRGYTRCIGRGDGR